MKIQNDTIKDLIEKYQSHKESGDFCCRYDPNMAAYHYKWAAIIKKELVKINKGAK